MRSDKPPERSEEEAKQTVILSISTGSFKVNLYIIALMWILDIKTFLFSVESCGDNF